MPISPACYGQMIFVGSYGPLINLVLIKLVGAISQHLLNQFHWNFMGIFSIKSRCACPNLHNFVWVISVTNGDIGIVLKFWGYSDMKFCIPTEACPTPSTS